MIQKKLFLGMNSDSDPRGMEQGQYRYALNVRVTNMEEGSSGAITNEKGNTLVNYSLPSGGNKVIGTFFHEASQRVFYAVWNSNSDHSLLYYDVVANDVTLVLQDAQLGFGDGNFVVDFELIETPYGDVLLWTDGATEPKKLIVNKAIDRTDNYQGDWAAGGYLTGEYVKVDFANVAGSSIDWYTAYYRANTATTQQPYTGIDNPSPQSDWTQLLPGEVYPDPLSLADITLMPAAPLNAPIAYYNSNAQKTYNRLYKKLYQFKYKYVYADGQESAWSPHSKVPLPQSIGTFEDGGFKSYEDNEIYIFMDAKNNTSVSKILIAARSGGDDAAKEDYVQVAELTRDDLLQSYVKQPDAPEGYVRYVFDGSTTAIPINVTDSNQLFYWVPRKAGALSLLSRNIVALADTTHGYSNSAAVSLKNFPAGIDYTFTDYTGESATEFTVGGYPVVGTANSFTIDFSNSGTITSFNKNTTISIKFTADFTFVNKTPPYFTREEPRVFSYAIKATSSDTPTTVAAKFAAAINSYPAFYVEEYFLEVMETKGVTASSASAVLTITGQNYTAGTNWNLNATAPGNTQIDVFSSDYSYVAQYIDFVSGGSALRGSSTALGLVYTDEFGRVSSVITGDSLISKIPWYTDTGAVNNGTVGIRLSLFHSPPSWATKVHVVKRRSNGISNFVDVAMSIKNTDISNCYNNDKVASTAYPYIVGYLTTSDTNGEVWQPNVLKNGQPKQYMYIYLNSLNGDNDNSFNNRTSSSVLSYSYTAGDRIRFIHTGLFTSNVPTKWLDDDVEILEYNQEYNRITIDYDSLNASIKAEFPFLDPTLGELDRPPASANGSLFRIYSPGNNLNEDFFYEIGETYDIVGGFHTGNVQNQTANTPAIIEINHWDSYYKTRTYNTDGATTQQTYALEDYNYSDIFISSFTSIGRPNITFNAETREELSKGSVDEQIRPATIFYSQPFDNETLINKLGTIYDLNFKQMDESFGPIEKMYSQGDRLFTYQPDRTASMYVDRSVSTDLQGNQTVAQGVSTPVLSDYVYYDAISGTKRPESFAAAGYRKYYVDEKRGEVIRQSMDGVTNINNGMNGYIKSLMKKVNASTLEPQVRGVYNKRNDSYLMNVKWAETTNFGAPRVNLNDTIDLTIPADVYESQFYEGQQLVGYGQSGSPYDLVVDSVSSVEVVLAYTDSAIETELSISLDVYYTTTIEYSEGLSAWTCFWSYEPDWMTASGIDVATFKNGQFYQHNTNNVRGRFYGVDYPSEVTVVGNENPDMNKIFKTASLTAEGIAFGESVVDAPEIATSLGQSSSLIQQDFSFREGDMHSYLLKDANTPNVTHPLLNGDELRGDWISIKFRWGEGATKLIKFFTAKIGYVLSSFSR